MPGVLNGYRVIDLTDARGMFAAKVLSDMGAAVVRIEQPASRETVTDAEFLYLNAGKRRVSLNLEQDAGRERLQKLVGESDILVESFKPGYLGSRGLGYAELARDNPGLVMASITDFGQTGPYRDFNSSELVAEALGGWMSVTGEPDTPLQLAGRQAYRTASLFAVNGIMLALWHRHASGRGQYIDISVHECVAATLDHVLVRYAATGDTGTRRGSRHWNNAFRVFPGRDGHILMTIHHEWDTLVEWLGSEGMAEDLADARWRDAAVRNADIGHVIAVLERWTRRHTVAELVETGQLMRFPWAKVTTVADLTASPHLAARDYYTEIEYRGKTCRAPGAPVKMSRSPWRTGGIFTEPEDGMNI